MYNSKIGREEEEGKVFAVGFQQTLLNSQFFEVAPIFRNTTKNDTIFESPFESLVKVAKCTPLQNFFFLLKYLYLRHAVKDISKSFSSLITKVFFFSLVMMRE